MHKDAFCICVPKCVHWYNLFKWKKLIRKPIQKHILTRFIFFLYKLSCIFPHNYLGDYLSNILIKLTNLNERKYNNHGIGFYHRISLIIVHIVMTYELIAYKLVFHLFPRTDLSDDDDQLVPFRNYSFLKPT